MSPFRFLRRWLALGQDTLRQGMVLLVVVVLGIVYASTLQTHISGSFQESDPAHILKNEYIKDVSEIQVALNIWGTVHHTGYPLYALVGNLFTLPLRAVGVEPAAAASLYALMWGIVALLAAGVLIARLTGRTALAALSVLLLGVTRTTWLHSVIAEVYSMSLAITAILLLIALWPVPWSGAWGVRRRVLWMALIGGIGVAHHRAIVFVAPGLLAAMWPHLRADVRANPARWRQLVPAAVGLALLGFVPYLYLPIREWQGGAWVYGEPGSWAGFWTEFTGREAAHLVTLPDGLNGLWGNVRGVWDILVHELTLPGLLVSLAGFGWAVSVSPRWHEARLLALSAAGPLLFAVFYHTAVMPQAVLMPVVMILVAAFALALDDLLERLPARHIPAISMALAAGLLLWTAALVAWSYPLIDELVSEPGGLETIARLHHVPRTDESGAPIKAVVMLPWGPHYSAAAYARLVTGELAWLEVVDHKGNYPALLAEGFRLYTLPETFYTYPPPWPSAYGAPGDWWAQHLGALTITSAAPGIVQLLNAPWLSAPNDPAGQPVVYGIARRDAWLTCDAGHIYLHVIWTADRRPEGDPSIFVHLTGDVPAPNPPNADARHPVYGAYPFAAWSPGEIVRDDFTLPRLPDRTLVRFGLYEQDSGGQFVNYGETALPVEACQPVEAVRAAP